MEVRAIALPVDGDDVTSCYRAESCARIPAGTDVGLWVICKGVAANLYLGEVKYPYLDIATMA